jgi:hypothetical protein
VPQHQGVMGRFCNAHRFFEDQQREHQPKKTKISTAMSPAKEPHRQTIWRRGNKAKQAALEKAEAEAEALEKTKIKKKQSNDKQRAKKKRAEEAARKIVPPAILESFGGNFPAGTDPALVLSFIAKMRQHLDEMESKVLEDLVRQKEAAPAPPASGVQQMPNAEKPDDG